MSWLSVASRILGSSCGWGSGRLVSTVLRPKHQLTTAATRFRSTHAADCDAVVIGAGVIGLAVARALALQGWSVVVLEAGSGIGTGTSSRNSEVIHAGIYYPPGSLKAQLCVEGKRKLYELCGQRSIPHRRIGKLIVATADEQRGRLLQLAKTAARNGVADLQLLEPEQVAEMEPELSCVAALHSPSTGIVDSHALMLVLQGDAEAKGAVFAFHSEVVGGQLQSGSSRPHRLDVRDVSGDCSSVFATHVINAAGLSAHHVARQVAGFPQEQLPPLHLAKGNYFALQQSRPPFQRLVYPVPPEGGLGVHLTLDLSGRARFGPDVEWLTGEVDGVAERSLDFSVDASRAAAFEQGIRQWWPGLPAGQLQPDYSGVRPKLSGPGEPAADFLVQDSGRWVDLLGVESPGLTSALAIADMVTGMLK